MKQYIFLSCFLLFLLLNRCTGRTTDNNQKQVIDPNGIVGGGCDDCEIMFEGMPENLSSVDTSAGWNETGQKLIVTGTVFKLDGKTPAPNIVIYYHQTDNTGHYTKTMTEKTLHGHLRGWLKTYKDGSYKLYTIRPTSYPNSTIPAHIHLTIKEPNINNAYYIDDVLFDDDKFLNELERKKLNERGGNGIGKIQTQNNIQYITRDIILGQNIPDYPY